MIQIVKGFDNYKNRTIVELRKNGLVVGSLTLAEHYGYDWFMDYMSEETFQSLTTDDSFLVLHQLYVDPRNRHKGYANELMTEAQKIIKQKFNNYEKIFLYADPFESNIELNLLKKFYNKYGFTELDIPELLYYNYDVALNYKNNLMLKNLN